MIVAEVGLPETVGMAFTVTVAVAVLTHPFASVPVTVYVVVVVGVATGEAEVIELNPVDGDQAYVKAPLVVNVTLEPKQTDEVDKVFIVGNAFTFTVMTFEY